MITQTTRTTMMNRRFVLAAILVVLALAVPAARADDDTIFEKVRQRLNNDPDIKGSRLTIDVKDGVVTLKGTVTEERFKAKADKLTRRVAGVKNVVNQLTVETLRPPR